jgi:hypothetical protein
MNQPVQIMRSKGGNTHELFATVDLGDETGWPDSLPSEVTELLRGYSDGESVPNGHEVNASDGYHYRLLF